MLVVLRTFKDMPRPDIAHVSAQIFEELREKGTNNSWRTNSPILSDSLTAISCTKIHHFAEGILLRSYCTLNTLGCIFQNITTVEWIVSIEFLAASTL